MLPPCHTMPRPPVAGIGLKPMHFEEILATRPALGFFEIHAENYLGAGGPMLRALERVRSHYPVTIHGVGLSLGGTAPLDETHLARVATLVERVAPRVFSEHLAWSAHGGICYNDLLPMCYDRTQLARTCANIDRIQTRLGRQILLENPATYLQHRDATLDEADFITEVVRRSGCGLLLDLTNALISCVNHGQAASAASAGSAVSAYLARLPLAAVGEIHLAGFARDRDRHGEPVLIDDHGSAVDTPVWALYRSLLPQLADVPTLIERDNAVPPLALLLAEAQEADRIASACAARSVTPLRVTA